MRERHGGFDGIEACANDLRAATVVGIEERLDACLASALDLKKRRPAGQEIAKQDGVALFEPFQGLRIALLEGVGQAVGQAGLIGDQLATTLGQANQSTHGDALRLKRRKSLPVAHQQIQSQLGIGRIVLGSAGLERFAIFGQGQRIAWKEHEEVILLERVDNRPLGQCKSNRDGSTKALVQRFGPFIDACNLMGNAIELALIVIGRLQADVVLGICPIDADIGGE